jgi:hypothetical protein
MTRSGLKQGLFLRVSKRRKPEAQSLDQYAGKPESPE